MEKYIRLLGILFKILGVVSAFGKEYILAVILVILGFISIIAALIESIIKTKEKTKQIEKEENGKTERVKIAEEGRTERTRIMTSGSIQQLKSLSNIYKNISASMPPEELQKLNNNNVTFYSDYIRNKSKNIMSENYTEDEIPSDESNQKENSQNANEKNDDESNNVKNEILELTKVISQLIQLKKDGSNGN